MLVLTHEQTCVFLPGKVHRRRPPLPQTDLGSVQTGFPRHQDPEPEHTSASGTVARNKHHCVLTLDVLLFHTKTEII